MSPPRRFSWRAARARWWARQRAVPPRCPRGWTTGPPDFVGVGTHKSGTSWWYRLLSRHPDVTARGHPKELDYFWRVGDGFTDEDAARYALWFPRPPGRLTGEWTPRYGDVATTPARLAAAAPGARLLVLFRDPIERYRSDVTMLRTRVPEPEATAVHRGCYGQQVERLLEHFPRERLLLLQYERCAARPLEELARTFRFLGLDDRHRPWWPSRGVHVTRDQKFALDDDRRRDLVRRYEPEVETLRRHMPDLDLSLWPSVAHLR